MYRLKKAFYELKQSPWASLDKFSDVVLMMGFPRSASEHSLFNSSSSKGSVIIVVYVDAIVLNTSDSKGIATVKNGLHKYLDTSI